MFELTDAIITGEPQPSPVHLSLQPHHRRTWGSLYAALAQGYIDTEQIRTLLSHYPLDLSGPPDSAGSRHVYAVDTSVWPRCDAEASPDRGYYYHPSRHSAGQPIVAGWAYQWVAQVGFERDSWTAPVDVRRVHPSESAYLVAVEQIRSLLNRMEPSTSSRSVPIFVFDAGYEPAQLAEQLRKFKAPSSILVRLRSGRCFYGDPLSPAECGTGLGTPGGRSRRHGQKFECYNPTTWHSPRFEYHCHDAQYGQVRVRAWCELHAKTQSHCTQGTRMARPISKGTLVLVEVSRLPRKTREPQVLRVWYIGPGANEPDLDLLWRAYVRRFDLEHTFRLL